MKTVKIKGTNITGEYKPDWICLSPNDMKLPISPIIESFEPEIYKEICGSNYKMMMTEGEFPLIKAIHHDGECVGISAYEFSAEIGLILELIYIKEEFRRNGLLKNELEDAESKLLPSLGLEDKYVVIDNPSKNLMEGLVKHGLAFFDDDWIISPTYPLSIWLDKKSFILTPFYNHKYCAAFSCLNINNKKALIRTPLNDCDVRDYNAPLLLHSTEQEQIQDDYDFLVEEYSDLIIHKLE